jgi:IMP cyclohydrolase
MNCLMNNTYLGRGIIIGKTSDSKRIIQIYWLMGRSENSRNRIFKIIENNFVKTEAYDIKKLTDPSLIIYYPIKSINDYHIVSNGDQTETIYQYLKDNISFEEALKEQLYEPDKPNYTPRISGLVNIKTNEYKLSIVKTINNDINYFVRQVFSYNNLIPGKGYCITTYEKDGNPLPSYIGEPSLVEIYNSVDKNIEKYWEILDENNRVAILVKSINVEDGKDNIKIINRNK